MVHVARFIYFVLIISNNKTNKRKMENKRNKLCLIRKQWGEGVGGSTSLGNEKHRERRRLVEERPVSPICKGEARKWWGS